MAPRKNAASVFMPTKVKRLMQADKEVGKMVAEVPILMACAVEMLLADILKAANAIRLQGTTKLLTAAHLEQVMNQNPEYTAVRPPLNSGVIALHPHEFIAKYSKQSYLMQKPQFGDSGKQQYEYVASSYGAPNTKKESSLSRSMNDEDDEDNSNQSSGLESSEDDEG